MKKNKSLHENLGIFIGRLLAKNETTSQPTGSPRFGRVSIEKQLRRALMNPEQRRIRRMQLRHKGGCKLSSADFQQMRYNLAKRVGAHAH